ncbi:hypothetical protein ABPG74_009499 [Tetrahymena malaccensis]
MQFYQIFLIFLVINRFINCQSSPNSQNITATPQQNAVNCIQNLDNPCQASDQDCVDGFQSYNSCSSQCMADQGSISSLRHCINDCKANTTKLSGYIDQITNCINIAISTFLSVQIISVILLMLSL